MFYCLNWQKHPQTQQYPKRVKPIRALCLSVNVISVCPHSFVVRLVAIVAGGQVSDSRDAEAATFCGVRVRFAAEVAQTFKQTVDDFLIVADKVGVFADVVAIPEQLKKQKRRFDLTTHEWV